MTDVQHGSLAPGSASGIHVLHAWAPADATARNALAVVAGDVGKAALQLDTKAVYVLVGVSPTTWLQVADATIVASKLVPSVVYTASTTLQASDADKSIGLNAASAHTITVPPNVFSVGQVLTGIQLGAGRSQFVAGAGVTLNAAIGLYTRLQYAPWALYQRSANSWELTGDLSVS